ncbi:MAG: DUF86 domain-containing protein [Pseudomonadota bacterium]
MLDHARAAVEIVGMSSLEEFSADRTRVLATTRAVQVVGEAANEVAAEVQRGLPSVPRRDAIAMRRKLLHGYRTVLPGIIHKTVRENFPALIAELERLLNERAKSDGA